MAKGNFIEYVVSNNPNKYPNGGEQGDYYYELINQSYTFDIKYEGTADGASVCYFYNNNRNILKLNSNYQNITCDGYIFINRFENINVSTTITFIFSDDSSDYLSNSRTYGGYGLNPTGISVVNLDLVSQHNSNKQIKNIIVNYLN